MYKRTTFEEVSAQKRIKGRVLNTLEFDKITGRLVEYAHTEYGRELCQALKPTSEYDEVVKSLDETYEVFMYINKVLFYGNE